MPSHGGQIALIIDDMGYRQQDAEAFALPPSVTFAILPHTPFSTDFAKRAADQTREVMIHMPMEALAGNKLGPGALTSLMTRESIQKELQSALISIPNAVGINNHMGSKLTQLTAPMQATMDFLQQRSLYFIDSRTTRYSKAEKIALSNGVLSASRHVFLDHESNDAHMKEQFDRLLRIAVKHEQAIGIGHPHEKTLAFLHQQLPRLNEMGIELVPVSRLLAARTARLEQKPPSNTEE
ncbi:divergent polysaccharide deacetylase family protein [Aliiglaciecola sp. CAU 1673]|uniref:divergent polysaccharide deacetylase family protein n=1 Tax=Aliiglaciecola sp. CAU 1673 TaxID=3032595 RepID=UPI0023DAD9BA|nr:divergent polysaccharide deacetylase family protein [Aliiglaciecola sp. CAU 1673]MDF2178705.1 divergent polysaccharide deacetylase family protein [Aliiglaciecola sp. CAU 1673]